MTGGYGGNSAGGMNLNTMNSGGSSYMGGGGAMGGSAMGSGYGGGMGGMQGQQYRANPPPNPFMK